MMKKKFTKTILFLSILTLFSCALQQVPPERLKAIEPVTLYETSYSYLEEKSMGTENGILIKQKSDDHITIEGVFNLKTGKKVKNGTSAWAIRYNDSNYFNLGYSSDVNNWYSYAKLDLEGKYCAVIIDENAPKAFRFTGKNYGGGLAGALMTDSQKWGKNWKTKDGKKIKILFIDTEDVSSQALSRNESSHGNYLSRKQVEKLLKRTGTNLNGEKVKDLEVDEIIELIKLANKK